MYTCTSIAVALLCPFVIISNNYKFTIIAAKCVTYYFCNNEMNYFFLNFSKHGIQNCTVGEKMMDLYCIRDPQHKRETPGKPARDVFVAISSNGLLVKGSIFSNGTVVKQIRRGAFYVAQNFQQKIEAQETFLSFDKDTKVKLHNTRSHLSFLLFYETV